MKRITLSLLLLGVISLGGYAQQSVSIGTDQINNNAVLWLQGNGSQGLILPIVTNKSAASATKGMVVFDDSDKKVYYNNGTAWIEVGGSGTGVAQTLSITGNTLSISSGNSVQISGTNPTVAGQLLNWNGTQWASTNATAPTTGQVLKWNGTAWAPGIDNTGGASIILGNGQLITGNGTANTATTITGDVTLNGSNLTISPNAVNSSKIVDGSILGTDLNPMSATNGQVLKYNGTTWAPGTDNVGGAATTLSNGQILTGDGTTNSATTLAGDATLNGGTLTITNNAVNSAKILDGTITSTDIADGTIQAADLNGMSATNGQVLQFNGTLWNPATLPAGGTVTSVSGTGPISVTTPTTTPVISIAQANGTTNGFLSSVDWATFSAKLGAASTTGGDLSGTIVSPTVVGIQGQPIANTTPIGGQVLKFNGTNWAPAPDDAGAGGAPTLANGEILIGNGSTNSGAALAGDATLSGSTMTIANNAINSAKISDGSIVNADVNTAAAISGSKILPDFGAQNVSTTGSTSTSQLIVNNEIRLGANPGTSGQVLTSSGPGTVPTWTNPGGSGTVTSVSGTGPISVTTPTTTPVISIAQANGTTNGFLSSVDWTSFSAKLGAASITGGDLSGTIVSPTVVGIQGQPVANTTPIGGQVLKFNGTNWAPAPDDAGAGGAPTLANGEILIGDGSTNSGAALAGDATLSGSTMTIANNAINSAKIADGSIQAADLNAMGASASQVLQFNGSAWAPALLPVATGTVTSVGLTMPSIFTVTGSPVTTTGTLDATFVSQTAATVFAAPAGAAGVPTFRALAATDIPTLNQNTTGTAATITGNITQTQVTNLTTDLGNKVTANGAITAGTNTKITYDAKGLVTAGAPLVASDLPVMTSTVGGAVPTPPNNTTTFLRGDGTFATPAGGGTVTAVSVATANGFSGTSSGGATPAITLTTPLTGVLKGDGTAMSAAVAGTDYLTPTGSAALLTGFPILNQNTTGTAATITGNITQAQVTNLTTDLGNKVTANGAITAGTNTKITYDAKGLVTAGAPLVASDLPVMTSTVGGAVPTPPNNTTTFLRGDGTFATPAGGGTVTTVSITTANGVSGTVTTPTSTPAISLTLGAITPTSVAATGLVSGTNLSGTNTGDNAVNSLYSGLIASQAAATVFAAPAGAAGVPTFRALTGTDIPNLDASKITTGTLPITQGGTGATTPAAALTNLGAMSNSLNAGQLFVGNGSNIATGVAMSGDGTMSSAGAFAIAPGVIVDADVNAAAAIAGTKVNPNFGAQNVVTTGTLTSGTAGAFAVDATGNITKIRNVTTTFPAANASGVLTNDGTGTLTWAGGSGWGLTGNAGTNPATNFVGTTDIQGLSFRTNNTERMRIASDNNGGTNLFTIPAGAGTEFYFPSGGDNIDFVAESQFNLESSTQIFMEAPSGVLLQPGGGGNVGIGTVTPNASLQFASSLAKRKIVLFEAANNDHEYFGFGVTNAELRYHTDKNSSHVFSSGVNSTTSTEIMRIQSDGNVGIGTATPGNLLTIQPPIGGGQLELRGDGSGAPMALTFGDGTNSNFAVLSVNPTITSSYGLYLPGSGPTVAGQMLVSDLTGNLSWASPAGSFNTLNTIPKGDGSTLVASKIFDDGTNVGIGTTTPGTTLEVFAASPTLRMHSSGNSSSIEFINAGSGSIGSIGDPGSSEDLQIAATNRLFFNTNFSTRAAIDNAGNLGLGTITPTQVLDVVGNVKFSGALMPNNLPGTAGQVLTSAGPGVAPTWQPVGAGSGWTLTGNAGTTFGTNFIGTTDPTGLSFKTNNLQRMYIDASGRTVIDINNLNPIAAPVSNAILDIVPSGAGIGNIVLRGSFANQNDPVDIEFRNWAGNTTLGAMAMDFTGQNMIFNVAGSTRMTLENAGAVNFSGNVIELGGVEAMKNTGTGNIFVGGNNANSNTASFGTFLGVAAGRDNTTGTDNTFIGRNAGLVNTVGTLNVMVGSGSGQASTGSSNTFVGYRAGFGNTSGIRNVMIGREADVSSNNLTNAIAIGYQAVAGASNTMALGGVLGSGNEVSVGIGTSTTLSKLQVEDNSSGYVARFNNGSTSGADGIVVKAGPATPTNGTFFILFQDGVNSLTQGSIQATGAGGVSFNTTSDRRLKQGISDIQNGLELLQSIKPRRFAYKARPDYIQTGFIAQELQPILPEAVSGNPDGDVNESPMTIDYSKLTPVLAASIKELHQLVLEQSAKIDALEKENHTLKSENGSLESKVSEIEAQQQALAKDLEEIKRLLGTEAKK